MNEKISIIVPVYNAEIYLRQCLESIVKQSYRNLQIICVDDGSTDNSMNILKEYSKKDYRVVVISKDNEGVSIARNLALGIADGTYLMFVDSDDWIDEYTCEVAIKSATENAADIVMWPYVREMRDKSSKKCLFNEDIIFDELEVKKKLHRRMIGLYDDELNKPENADALCTVWGKLYRSDIVKQNDIQFYDIRKIGTYEDGLFNLEYFHYTKKAVYINKHLYHYRRTNENSITNVYNSNLHIQWNHLFKIMKNYIYDKRLDESYIQALKNRISLSLIVLGINTVSAPVSVVKKLKELGSIISQSQYKKAIDTLQLSKLPIHWKLFFFCAKYEITWGVYFFLIVIQKIRGR